MASCLSGLLYPVAEFVVAVVIVPEIEVVADGDLPTTLAGFPVKVFDLAYVDPEQSVATLDTLLDFVLDPSACACLCTNKDRSDRGALELCIDPVLDSLITLFLDLFKISFIDKPSRFLPLLS